MSGNDKIGDFGEKIGGARKDLFSDEIRSRGLSYSDVGNWTEIEKDKYISKKYVWSPPDYQKLVDEGTSLRAAYFIKRVYDSLPAKPPNGSSESNRKGYIDTVTDIKERCAAIKTDSNIKEFAGNVRRDYDLYMSDWYYSERNSFGCFTGKFRKAITVSDSLYELDRDIVKKQFLYTDEQKVLSEYKILKYDGSNVSVDKEIDCMAIKRGASTYYSYRNDESFTNLSNWQKDSYFILDRRNRVVGINLSTVDEAKAFAVKFDKELADGAEKSKGKNRKTRFKPPQLDSIKRTGEDYRNSRDISGDDMLKDLGFRGGEFGNWENQNNRQHNLNMSYDAFRDLAKALGISDSDVSLGGELAIAYGARGRSSAAAHFEPDRNVINLTKTNGAGALGHEWGHALDYYLARNSGAKTVHLSEGAYKKDSPMFELMQTIKYRNGSFSDFYKDAKKMDRLHSKTDKGYWASDVELFARAFHCYVMDKLKPERSDYLCGLAETSSVDDKGNSVLTYPAGEERKDINEQFDKLIGDLKEKGLLHNIEKSKPQVLESSAAYRNVQNEYEQISFDDVLSANVTDKALREVRPTLFSIEQNGMRREYINGENSLFELLDTSSRQTPYLQLMKCGKEIGSDRYAEIQQSKDFRCSVDINLDEKTVTVYKVNGSFSEPDRTETNSSIDTYDLDKIKGLVNEIHSEASDRELRDKLLDERIGNCKSKDIALDAPESLEKDNEIMSGTPERSDALISKENPPLTEEKILEMAAKIQRNISENKRFSADLDKYLANPNTEIFPIKIGTTPNSLSIAGADPSLDIVINPSTVKKCMSEPDTHYHGHGLSAELMKLIPVELRNPTMIFKGSKSNSLVAITELKDYEQRGIMIAVSLNEMKNHHEVNRISSVYGRNNMTNYLKAQIEQGNLIAANKEKANEMLQTIGLQLPLEETFISFDNSITYSLDNVNYPQADLTKNIQSKETSELFSVSDSQKANPIKSAVKEEKNQVKIRCFSENDGVYRAHILHDGEKQWRIVRSEDGKLYVTTGSKRNNDLKKHYLNNEQADRFRDFVMNGVRTVENNASVNKSIPASAKLRIKKL